MKVATIIGLGNIGYRHFQGISKLKNKIYLIDPFIKKKNLKKFLINENIHYVKEYSKLPKKIDLAIISCSADVRLNCIKKLLKSSKVKNIILEKILFNKLNDYENIKFIHKRKINIWVNSNFRSYHFVKEIKKNNNKLLELKVIGNSWGIACNFIHFLDLINYFNNELSYKIIENNLSSVYKTKRKGFYDFYGNLKLKTNKNTKIFFQSLRGRLSLKVYLVFEKSSYLIDMIKNEVITKKLISKKISIKKNVIPYVSNQSGLFAKKIYRNNFNDLPKLKESCLLHFLLIKVFCDSFYRIKKGGKKSYCPIT